MNEECLKCLISNGTIDNLIYKEKTTSTNDIEKEIAAKGFTGKSLAVTEIQTNGRGRNGRHWESPEGSGIWMSLLTTPQKNDLCFSSVTLLSALAITRAINAQYSEMLIANSEVLKNLHSNDFSAQIKWPNDVIINKKKISGILTEMISTGSSAPDSNHIIAGIGINVNTVSFPSEISDKATSLFLETGMLWNRESLIIKVIENLVNAEEIFEKEGSLAPFVNEYNSLLINKDKEVILSSENIVFPDNPYIARGIDNDGSLVVEDSSKNLHSISCGEISVRGVLGYV